MLWIWIMLGDSKTTIRCFKKYKLPIIYNHFTWAPLFTTETTRKFVSIENQWELPGFAVLRSLRESASTITVRSEQVMLKHISQWCVCHHQINSPLIMLESCKANGWIVCSIVGSTCLSTYAQEQPALKMDWLSWRFSRLKLETSAGELLIDLEESIEWTSNEWKLLTCDWLDLESLGPWPTMPKNLVLFGLLWVVSIANGCQPQLTPSTRARMPILCKICIQQI